MKCPKCGSTHIRKNGKRGDEQNHICADCGRQFIDNYSAIAYSPKIKTMRSPHHSNHQTAITVAIGRHEVILLKCVTKNIFMHIVYVCKLNGIQKKPTLIFKSMAYGFPMPRLFCMIPMRFLVKTRQPKVSKDLS